MNEKDTQIRDKVREIRDQLTTIINEIHHYKINKKLYPYIEKENDKLITLATELKEILNEA